MLLIDFIKTRNIHLYWEKSIMYEYDLSAHASDKSDFNFLNIDPNNYKKYKLIVLSFKGENKVDEFTLIGSCLINENDYNFRKKLPYKSLLFNKLQYDYTYNLEYYDGLKVYKPFIGHYTTNRCANSIYNGEYNPLSSILFELERSKGIDILVDSLLHSTCYIKTPIDDFSFRDKIKFKLFIKKKTRMP